MLQFYLPVLSTRVRLAPNYHLYLAWITCEDIAFKRFGGYRVPFACERSCSKARRVSNFNNNVPHGVSNPAYIAYRYTSLAIAYMEYCMYKHICNNASPPVIGMCDWDIEYRDNRHGISRGDLLWRYYLIFNCSGICKYMQRLKCWRDHY